MPFRASTRVTNRWPPRPLPAVERRQTRTRIAQRWLRQDFLSIRISTTFLFNFCKAVPQLSRKFLESLMQWCLREWCVVVDIMFNYNLYIRTLKRLYVLGERRDVGRVAEASACSRRAWDGDSLGRPLPISRPPSPAPRRGSLSHPLTLTLALIPRPPTVYSIENESFLLSMASPATFSESIFQNVPANFEKTFEKVLPEPSATRSD